MLWKQYRNKAQEMRERSQMFRSECPPLRPAIPDIDMTLPTCLQQQQFDKSLNEVLLFHGTKSSNVGQIAEEGFDERVCSLDGMFGGGLYFAEDSCKAGQYAERCTSCHNPRPGSCSHWFFLSRVLL